MRIKYFLVSTLLLSGLVFSSIANAATFSIKMGTPKSPITQNSINLTYVGLDTSKQNREITVKCFKKGPKETNFTEFGESVTLIPGGNVDQCIVDNKILTTPGSYNFFVSANIQNEIVKSDEISFDYEPENSVLGTSVEQNSSNTYMYFIPIAVIVGSFVLSRRRINS